MKSVDKSNPLINYYLVMEKALLRHMERVVLWLMLVVAIITPYLCMLVIGIAIGYGIKWVQDLDKPVYYQIPAQIRDEMSKPKPIVFHIQDLEFTKRADGSAILRIIKEGKQ